MQGIPTLDYEICLNAIIGVIGRKLGCIPLVLLTAAYYTEEENFNVIWKGDSNHGTDIKGKDCVYHWGS